MMQPRLRHLVIALVALAAACSGNRATGSATAVIPPHRLGSDNPDFQNVKPAGDSRTDIAVMVGTDGRPEMSTLKVTGSGAPALRDVITDWIARSTFEPAKADGVPVRAEFRMQIESKVTVQRR